MDSLNHFRERLETLEQHTEELERRTHMVARRLRRWRGLNSRCSKTWR
jgi:hypothetical protein